ncbi:hypothetical protein PsorP6_005016 [Peronosclerospora sorghi]|uniref:Uncharacterized protein n=1 Tax=Peronosclerospora sorghi TaxID=230839 RepID=A0ACC0W3M2_9STRA|nr:hypothetical protein PsorP6_005016 [Peronosclerospora sorghi]
MMLNATREKEMKKKFGVDKSTSPKRMKKSKEDDGTTTEETTLRGTKRKRDKIQDEAEATDDDQHAKKPKKKPEANQKLADAFAELSGFEFKRGEKFKGSTWSKVAKAIRDCESEITCGKDALKLKGVGKSSAAKIDECIETGTIQILEEYRAGNM